MSTLEEIARVAVEAHSPAWAIQATQELIAQLGIPDTVVKGAIMPRVLIIIHHKKYNRLRPAVSMEAEPWDPDAQTWDEYKAAVIAQIAKCVSHWASKEAY